MSRHLSTRNISSKSMHAFLSNLAHRQTDRQTNEHGQKLIAPHLSEVNNNDMPPQVVTSEAVAIRCPQRPIYAATEAFMFLPTPSRLLSCDMGISFISREYSTTSMKFAGGNHYLQQIKWLHFGGNWNRNKGARYDRIFESTSFSVAAMSNGCWRLANEFINFTEYTCFSCHGNAGTETFINAAAEASNDRAQSLFL